MKLFKKTEAKRQDLTQQGTNRALSEVEMQAIGGGLNPQPLPPAPPPEFLRFER